ncbi:MAG: hypothetical protein GXX82_08530 [Syntrophorhabdus sp.]|nr:hypothetical protein [Syntrophorhabdus sp.]
MTSIQKKRAELEKKKQQRNKARQELAELEKKQGQEREKMFKRVANKVAWYALSQPVKVFATKNRQRVMAVDHAATWKLRARVIAIARMINEGRHPGDILDALIEFLKDEKARLTCADKRYGRPRDDGEGR